MECYLFENWNVLSCLTERKEASKGVNSGDVDALKGTD